jgi:hypothetical protein
LRPHAYARLEKSCDHTFTSATALSTVLHIAAPRNDHHYVPLSLGQLIGS